MLMNDVNLWFAKDSKENIVLIEEVDKNNKDKYFCPICGSEVIARQGTEKSWSFAHEDKSKCDGESRIHWWVKNKLIEKGTKFSIVSDKKREYVCKEILVEQAYEVDGKEYKPDVTVITETNEIIYFEMKYSNKKKIEDYIDLWIGLGNIVVEVDTKQLIDSTTKDKLEFKALYYNGKCFNVKKSCSTYYNTIGKYKEQVIEKGEYEQRKHEIKKLDWFWNDVIRYKKGEVEIEHMAQLIDSIEGEERNVVIEILDKPRCSDLYYNYINKKMSSILSYLKENLNKLNTEKYQIEIGEIYRQFRNKLKANIIFYDIDDKTIMNYDIAEYSANEILQDIKTRINNIYEREKHAKDLQYAKQNIHIKNVIEKINNELQKIDDNYCFHDKFRYDLLLSLHYNYNYKMDIRIDKDIIYLKDEQLIERFFKSHINKYLNTITPFSKTDELIEMINKLDLFYNNITTKEYTKVREKIGRRYIDKMSIDYYNYGVEYRMIAQNCIKIHVYKQELYSKYDYKTNLKNQKYKNIYIFKDGVYESRQCLLDDKIEIDDYKNILTPIKLFDIQSNINKLEMVLRDKISESIRNDKYGNMGVLHEK